MARKPKPRSNVTKSLHTVTSVTRLAAFLLNRDGPAAYDHDPAVAAAAALEILGHPFIAGDEVCERCRDVLGADMDARRAGGSK